ncbi:MULTISPECIES: hypothetical protein [Nocardiopsis]|uniref:Uncharacterized protein n=1 Tax=Nocardiopsis sinuspersici TaxID=501010 RepID=A0A1V3BYH6_9ACTN|nr:MULTISPECIES: hypothetical protein [Nocardiopsis]OOC53607.1 hypothetical protein NOSIN_07165 [Nocardiopsis sinuspersici]
MTLASRNTAGTRSIPDLIRDPRQWWWGIRGGNPEIAEQDLTELRQGLPLHSVAHLRHGRVFRQGVLVMHFAASERLTWRGWRPLRTYAAPVPVPGPTEVLDVREPSSLREAALGDVRFISFRAGVQVWEMAVVTIDATVVTTALTEARSWARKP